MKLEPYWLATAPQFTGGAAGGVEGRFDVAIIGGGFTGLSAAHALARAGASVAVLEAGRVVGQASGRNGGHCSNGLAHDLGTLAGKIGMERAAAMYRAFDEGVDAVETLVGEEGIDCGFRRTGRVKAAAKPEHYDKVKRSYAVLKREVEPDAELLGPADIRREVGSDKFYGGIVFPKSAQMHVARFGVGLAEAAARRGAQVYENAAVTALERLNGSGHRVTTTRGTLEAKQVLVATGVSRQGPLFWFRRRIIPIGSFIVATEPLPQSLVDAILPTRRSVSTTRHIGNYFRLAEDNRLIFGGRARFAMTSPSSDAKSGRILQASMRHYFPELADVRIDYCWGGLVDMTADRLPRTGEHAGLYYAVGLSGHGTQISVHLGQAMARRISGGTRAGDTLFDDPAWPAIPGHFGPPWFLPFIGAYYRFLDWRH
jgi:glycine/D-amino acid oxidase-like deaminating enzyme